MYYLEPKIVYHNFFLFTTFRAIFDFIHKNNPLKALRGLQKSVDYFWIIANCLP